MPEHPLEHQWVLWELKHLQDNKDYDNALREICEFKTAEEFWKYWAFIPRPTEIFSDGMKKKAIDGRMIKSFSVFKKGISPKWEDPANKGGSDLIALRNVTPENLDLLWENLVLGLIGETIDDGTNEVCGGRVVDQAKKGKSAYKIELWLKTKDDSVCFAIRDRLMKIIVDGLPKGSKYPDFDLSKRN